MHWKTEPRRLQIRNANGHPTRKEKCRLCGRGFHAGKWAYGLGRQTFHRSFSERYKQLQITECSNDLS